MHFSTKVRSSYIHKQSWLRHELINILWILFFFTIFDESLSVPSIPEIVFPHKNKFSRNVLKESTSANLIERDIANNTSKPRHSVSNTVSNFRVALHNRKRIHAAAQRRLNQASRSTNTDFSDTSAEGTRVILAPLDERRVYTADKYYMVSSERVDVDGDSEDTKKVSSEIISPKASDKGHKQEANRRASIKELEPEEMQRTTMHETGSPTTTLPTPARPPIATAKTHATESKSSKADQASLALQLVSHDTANRKLEQSIRFPAERWQLPPSLYSARLKSVEQLQVINPVQARHTKKNTTFYACQLDAQNRSYELARLNESSTSLLTNRTAIAHSHMTLNSIRSPSLSQFSPFTSRPLGRPNVSLTGGGVQSIHKKGLRAKFAFRHTDHQNKPIDLPASTDDSDLLSAPKTRPAINTFLPLPAARTFNTFNAQTTPLLIQPAEVTSAAYVARLSPNDKLDLCCKKQSVSSVCQGLCNFDTFTDRSLVSALLSNQCPGPQLRQAFDCATSKVDHSECCRRFNVHLHNGGQCMPFCETHLPTPPNVLSYIACLPIFENIKTCYRDFQYQHPNIYGD